MTDRFVAGIQCPDVADLAAGFVLGALEPAEMATVRAHLAACPEPHPEYAELGSVVPALLASVEPVEPRAALRDRVLAAARADAMPATDPVQATDRVRATDTSAAPVRAPIRVEERTRLPLLGGILGFRQPVWAGLGIAAVVAIAVLGATNLQLRSERDQLAQYERVVAAVMIDAHGTDMQFAVLASGPGGPPVNGLATVSTKTGSFRLAIRGLAPTTGTQVYEAWYVPTGGAPLPIDGFTVGSTGTGTLDGAWSVPSGTTAGGTVAVTLEPAPGPTAPTLPILVSGAAG